MVVGVWCLSVVLLSGCASQSALQPIAPVPGGETLVGQIVGTDGMDYTKRGQPVSVSRLVKVSSSGREYVALADSTLSVGDWVRIEAGVNNEWFVVAREAAQQTSDSTGMPTVAAAPKEVAGPRYLTDQEKKAYWDSHVGLYQKSRDFRRMEIDERLMAASGGYDESSIDAAIKKVKGANRPLSRVTVTWFDYSSGVAKKRTYKPSTYGTRLVGKLVSQKTAYRDYIEQFNRGEDTTKAESRLKKLEKDLEADIDEHGEFISNMVWDPFTEYRW